MLANEKTALTMIVITIVIIVVVVADVVIVVAVVVSFQVLVGLSLGRLIVPCLRFGASRVSRRIVLL